MTPKSKFMLTLLSEKGPLFVHEIRDELQNTNFSMQFADIRKNKSINGMIRRVRFAGRASRWNGRYKDCQPIIIYYLWGQEREAFSKIERHFGPLHSNRKKEITMSLGLWEPHSKRVKNPRFERKWGVQ